MRVDAKDILSGGPDGGPRRDAVGAAVVALVVVAGLAGGFFQWRAAADRRDAIAAARAESQRLGDLVAASEKAAAALGETRQDLARLGEVVPPTAEIGDVLGFLGRAMAGEETAEREVLTLTTVSGRPFSRIPLMVRMTGSFAQAFTLLERVEAAPRLMRVDRLFIERTDRKANTPLRVEVDLSTFARDPEATSAWARVE